ncbi:uncharacterized protein LOC115626861 isoform X2 [Scaptodrosophila lebanonensis]|uniref:Uncharacterized protein LOC115626861 isoform X2 n=1 Tax=Drosophila lebanonensis TaxID=7225 RepID=A0A6J2TTI8_DROLE|nr:uncharacterized protein LOC115626861 isoform X2 [Scaptodrosophila lebanonensis]
MHFGISCAILVLLLATKTAPTDAVLEDVLDIIHVIKEVTTGILKAWDVVQSSPLASKIEFPLMREKQRKVLERLKEVNRQIEKTEEKQSQYTSLAIESVNDFIGTNVKLIAKMNEITDIMNRISSRYQQMTKYEAVKDKLEMVTLVTFAEWTVAPNAHSVHHLMDRLHLTLLGNTEKNNSSSGNLLAQLAANYEFSSSQICNMHQSPQQFVYALYSDIALTELKGYIMMEFSWMMLRVYGKGNFTQEAELMRNDYERRTERTLKLLQEVMRRSARIVWRCDPEPQHHVLGQTYDEVTRLLQGFIENEVDLNSDETCRETCSYYQNTRTESCFKEKFCARQPGCKGRLYNCQFVQSDMWVCQAPLNSTRRYEYVEYENGSVLGRRGRCVRGTSKVDSWWRYLFWHCSYCMCLCDEQSIKSDRFFNLREAVSDFTQNRVVTGLRFIKKNRIFHLQIQEGELLPRGNINQTSLTWKPVDNYNIFDRDVIKGVDYHSLSYESRSVDLDDINTDDPSFVVTGVRFRVVGTHLNLEARLTEINFETGKLVNSKELSYWNSNDNTDVSGDNRRKKLSISSPDIPTRTIVKSIPMSKHNEFIEFVNSDLYKDAAQTTVPFMDVQDVVSNPPVPLSGVGIYYKGRPGFGGFLAPKIITYDFTRHVVVPKRTP